MSTQTVTGTKFLDEVGPVETVTGVVLVTPPAPGSEAWMVQEGHLGQPLREGQYFKVVTEWVCPTCRGVHFDQNPQNWECRG